MYVARVAMGADPQQTLRAFREAEAYDGPSLVIAYSHCIAHGYDMRDGLDQQYRAVASGHWPLIRYDPVVRAAGGNPFLLDSPRPRMPLADYRKGELRFRALANADPAEAERLLGLAQQAADQRWQVYEEMATRGAARVPGRRPQGPVMDLSTRYMGLALRNPLVASASPLSATPSTAYGAWRTPASVRSSCTRCSRSSCARRPRGPPRSWTSPPRASPRRWTTFPPSPRRTPAHAAYLSLVERAAAAVDVPVIASLNGVTPEGWTDYARAMQDAGAAAIELNIYYLPGDPHISGRDVEQRHIDVLRRVKAAVTVPVAVKLSPYFSSIGEMALRLDEAGRRRARAVQPLPAARHRSRGTRASRPTSPLSSTGRRPAAADVDRAAARQGARLARGHRRRRRVRRRREVPARRRGRRDDRLGAAPARSRVRGPCCSTGCRPGWRARGSTSVDELRGMLAVPTASDGAEYERAGYVSALRAANARAPGPW